MKKIEAIVRPDKVSAIKKALVKCGVRGMTVTDVVGCGLQKGQVGIYRGNSYEINLLPKVKIEIVATDDMADEIIRIIMEQARTGEVGDGKIFVSEISQVYRIRTGETEKFAL
jgi:nitrogen regulatory protein P-II 1